MSDDLVVFEYAEPETLLGQLQRGRGLGARRALAEPEAGELVVGCVLRDPRWDAQTESRDEYLACLIHRMGLPLDPIAHHLLGEAEHAELRDVEHSLQVLAWLVELGRIDAAPLLRRYAAEGKHWEAAVDAVWDWEIADLWDGLDQEVLARLDDEQLAEVAYDWGPWPIWARSHQRVRAVLDDRTEARKNRPEWEVIKDLSSEVLLGRITAGTSPGRWRELLELAGRGELAILDFAENAELRSSGALPNIAAALRGLGDAAVGRARDWAAGTDPELRLLAVDVLAAGGDSADVPVLMNALTTALADEDWCGLETPAKGLGRLAADDAADHLVRAWESTVHSYARIAVFQGLTGCLPTGLDRFAVEGLDDCEVGVQEMACFKAPATPPVIEQLRAWQTGPDNSDRSTCASIRLQEIDEADGTSRSQRCDYE
ncbi:hypothetical protein ABH926_007655 [Catenulispora sp. GP43]|uniref:HEAT repeat domain-containing protein n=1 Tax=Catenulispora sp. GP43 TaxID=3156263 RepID=UPI0035192F38